jgi:hypothetical protein
VFFNAATCIAQPTTGGNTYATPSVSVEAVSVDTGHTTYTLKVTLTSRARNLYKIFGSAARPLLPLHMPPAFQNPAPFGADIGGVDPQFARFDPKTAFDSWLTIGFTAGAGGQLGSNGIAFNSWSATGALTSTSGALYLMDSTRPASPGAITVAQLTVAGPRGTATIPGSICSGGCPTMNLMGKSAVGQTDWQQPVTFTL